MRAGPFPAHADTLQNVMRSLQGREGATFDVETLPPTKCSVETRRMTEPHPWRAAVPWSHMLRRLDMRSSSREIAALTQCKRLIDLVVISDTHLGTFECHAKELLEYLDSIAPKILIDLWIGNKWTWNQTHTFVIKKILDLVICGTLICYIVGNHDQGLQNLSSINLGNFYLCNDLILNPDSQKTWFVHGDGFDVVVLHAKWLASLAPLDITY